VGQGRDGGSNFSAVIFSRQYPFVLLIEVEEKAKYSEVEKIKH
jgi:hypothetical protein